VADLVITAANVKPGTGMNPNSQYKSGATITQGQCVYLDTNNLWQLAKADTLIHSGQGVSVGIALNSALLNQPLSVGLIAPGGSPCQINLGATLAIGTVYVVAADTAGAIAPISDLSTGNIVTILGIATTAALLETMVSGATGISHA
jgi:hypothetical protein